MRSRIGWAACLAAGIVAAPLAVGAQQRAPAQAQPPAAAAPAAEATDGPERTAAQFGDWTVQCVTVPQGGRRICEMAQTVQDQQRQQPIAVIAVGRAARDQPLKLAVRVPVNVRVSDPARLVLEGPAGPANEPVALPFQRCSIQPVGCFAEAELRDDALRRLRTRPADRPGRVAWRDVAGAEIAVPVSFRGFAAAWDALQKEGS